MILALFAAVALVALALLTLRPADGERDGEARDHAEAACALTSKAEEAAQVETDARFAAAMLLLDEAIIESARAAETAVEFAHLDQAVQEVHAAAHRGSSGPWREALDAALAACDNSAG